VNNTPTKQNLTLVLGGARSGKSAYAEQLASRYQQCVYLATAEHIDAEMTQRITVHQARRAEQWRTIEEPLDLAIAIDRYCAKAHPAADCLLVDCLSVWIGNLMHHQRNVDNALAALLESLAPATSAIVRVANEVGLGIVPDNAESRLFRDHAGRLNQNVAAIAGHVVFVAAGLPLILKNTE
jgi:adenosylcobinamide kinase/adenosylcobinamide-phosphate guanylyltransferase